MEYPRDRNQLVVNLKSSTAYAPMEHIIAGMDIKDLCKKAIFKVKEMKLLKSELVERKVLNKSKILLTFSKNDMEYLNVNAEQENTSQLHNIVYNIHFRYMLDKHICIDCSLDWYSGRLISHYCDNCTHTWQICSETW